VVMSVWKGGDAAHTNTRARVLLRGKMLSKGFRFSTPI
jgi:hypothetical protein